MNAVSSDPYGVVMLESFEALGAARAFWLKQQDHANNDLSQFELVCRLRPEVLAPRVAMLTRDGQPSALLAARLERTHFAPPIGYLKPCSMKADVIAVLHRGALGSVDLEQASQCVAAFDELLRARAVDAVEFHFLQEDSNLLAALRAGGTAWRRRVMPRWSVHREMSLPPQGDFMSQRLRSKHRSWLRKKQREFDSDFAERIAWRWLIDVEDVDALCCALESVAATTYQRGLGAGFFDNQEYRERLGMFAQRGLLRVQLLEIDGVARAFWFGSIHKGVFHSSETGYDPALRQYEVGTLMFVRMVDALAREGVSRLDFGIGDAPYKERFADQSWRETSVWLFAPTIKGLAMRALLEATICLDSAARAVLKRSGLIGKLKTLWRRRLGSPQAVAPEAIGAPDERTGAGHRTAATR